MARYRGKTESAGEILARWLGARKDAPTFRQHAIRARWRALVGDRIASRTEPATLGRDGVLTVKVASSPWLNELVYLRGAMVAQINRLLGQRLVSAIRLVTGPVEPAPGPEPHERGDEHLAAYVELPPEELEQIDRELAGLVQDADLRQAIRAARVAQRARELRGGSVPRRDDHADPD